MGYANAPPPKDQYGFEKLKKDASLKKQVWLCGCRSECYVVPNETGQLVIKHKTQITSSPKFEMEVLSGQQTGTASLTKDQLALNADSWAQFLNATARSDQERISLKFCETGKYVVLGDQNRLFATGDSNCEKFLPPDVLTGRLRSQGRDYAVEEDGCIVFRPGNDIMTGNLVRVDEIPEGGKSTRVIRKELLAYIQSTLNRLNAEGFEASEAFLTATVVPKVLESIRRLSEMEDTKTRTALKCHFTGSIAGPWKIQPPVEERIWKGKNITYSELETDLCNVPYKTVKSTWQALAKVETKAIVDLESLRCSLWSCWDLLGGHQALESNTPPPELTLGKVRRLNGETFDCDFRGCWTVGDVRSRIVSAEGRWKSIRILHGDSVLTDDVRIPPLHDGSCLQVAFQTQLTGFPEATYIHNGLDVQSFSFGFTVAEGGSGSHWTMNFANGKGSTNCETGLAEALMKDWDFVHDIESDWSESGKRCSGGYDMISREAAEDLERLLRLLSSKCLSTRIHACQLVCCCRRPQNVGECVDLLVPIAEKDEGASGSAGLALASLYCRGISMRQEHKNAAVEALRAGLVADEWSHRLQSCCGLVLLGQIDVSVPEGGMHPSDDYDSGEIVKCLRHLAKLNVGPWSQTLFDNVK